MNLTPNVGQKVFGFGVFGYFGLFWGHFGGILGYFGLFWGHFGRCFLEAVQNPSAQMGIKGHFEKDISKVVKRGQKGASKSGQIYGQISTTRFWEGLVRGPSAKSHLSWRLRGGFLRANRIAQ